jgi:hypothetical protein
MKSSNGGSPAVRRRWRDYKTPSGRRPVDEFIDKLSNPDKAAVLAGMEDVRDRGLRAARHLDGDIWRYGRKAIVSSTASCSRRKAVGGKYCWHWRGSTRRPRGRLDLRSSWRRCGWRTGDDEETNCVPRAASARCIDEIGGIGGDVVFYP